MNTGRALSAAWCLCASCASAQPHAAPPLAILPPFAANVVREGPAAGAFHRALAASLGDHDAELQRCFYDQLSHLVAREGRIILRVVVDPDQRLRPVTVSADDIEVPALDACLISVVQHLELPPTGVTQPVGIDHTFRFRPLLLFIRRSPEFMFSESRLDRYELMIDAERVGPSAGDHAARDP